MRTWTRTATDTICGGICHRHLPANTPVIEIKLDGMKRSLIRCEECIGLNAPPDLPMHDTPQRRTSKMKPVANLAAAALAHIPQRGRR